MAAQFQADEPVPVGVRRILDECLDRIQADLRGTSSHRKAIHRTRRGCKQVRGVLRLVRSDLGSRWRLEDRWYRDFSRALGHVRDADVSLKTLNRIQGRFGSLVKERVFRVARRELRNSHAEATADLPTLRRRAALEIDVARERTTGLPVGVTQFDELALGLEATYRRGRKICRAAEPEGDPEEFHELRKRVKYLGYQISTFKAVAPLKVDRIHGKLTALGDVLGSSRDLIVLADRFQGESRPELSVVAALAFAWQEQLNREALAVATSFYGPTPKAFTEELRPHWLLWRRVREQAPVLDRAKDTLEDRDGAEDVEGPALSA